MAQFFYTVFFTVVLLFGTQLLEGAQLVGVCLQPPKKGHKLLSAEDAVSLLQQHKFGSVMMHKPDPDVVGAFRDIDIAVNLVIPNRHLEAISSDHAAARRWVASHIAPFSKAVKFRYVVAGNEGPNREDLYYDPHLAYGAMLNVRKALASFGLEKSIKVSTMVSTESLSWNPSHPSRAAFSRSAQADMVRIASVLSRNDAPLLVNVFPYFAYENLKGKGALLPYALMSSEAGSEVVKDGELEYRNLFDAMVDSMYAALDKAGAPNVRVVAETGWPITGRNEAASRENAEEYTKNLIDRVSSGTGTPMRPELKMEAYLHTLLVVQEQDGVEFGMIYHNKTAAFDIPSIGA